METQDELFGHLGSPSRRCQDESVGCTCLFRIDVELLCLARRLRAGPRDDEDVLVSMGIEGISRQTYCTFTLIMRKVLSLSVRSLNEDPVDGSLYRTVLRIIAFRELSEAGGKSKN
jgi:hypothetical protein